MSKENEGNSGMMTALIIGGGALAVYWYLNNYGPSGAVSAGYPSYWQSWFGTVTTPVVAAAPVTAPVVNTLGPVIPVAAPTPVVSAVVSGLSFPSPFTVAADINNSLKGTVLVNGVSTTLNVIPSAAGNASGVVWNTNGADVTAQFTAAQVQQLVQAFTQAASAQGISLSGIIQVPWQQTGANLSGIGMSFNSGKGFSRAFSGRRKSTGPYVN